MRWEDERYVKLYSRDTPEWMSLTFEAQGLFRILLTKVDKAGVLELGRLGLRGVAVVLGHAGRWDVIEDALDQLIVDGCVTVSDDKTRLLIPNFVDAQEARMSDRARQHEHRAKSRDMARAEVTDGHTTSHAVTRRHTPSHDVTPRGEEIRGEERERSASPPLETAPAAPAAPKAARRRRGKTEPRQESSPDVIAAAGRLWALQDRLRAEAMPGARPLKPKLEAVVARLAEYSEGDAEHVLAVYAAEARARGLAPGVRCWFDGVTNWRPDNFQRALGQPRPAEPDRSTTDRLLEDLDT
jgi:hypothetical protein